MKNKLGILNNLEIYIVAFGLFLVAFFNTNNIVSVNTQMNILMLFILLVGVPHGALDFLVAEQVDKKEKRKFNIIGFVSKYVFRLLIIALCWYNPFVAVTIFLLCSVFHFGETDLATLGFKNNTPKLIYFSHGLLVLAIVVLRPIQDILHAMPILNNAPEYTIQAIKTIISFKFYIIALTAVPTLIYLLQNCRKPTFTINYKKLLVYISLLCLVSFLTPLMGLAFYFVLWHSLVSLRNVWLFSVIGSTKKVILPKFILFSLISIVGLLGLYFTLGYFLPDVNLFLATFIVLSVLTFPHLLEMHKMYKTFSIN
jgi:beta-carotene 15,15'-dioxygenase